MLLKIKIKTRIWLLGLLFLSSLLLVLGLQYQRSSEELLRHRAMLERIAQAEHLSRLVHEVQKERGLSSSFLIGGEAAVRSELQAQRKATDFKLAQLGAAKDAGMLVGLEPMRERIDQAAVSKREAFDFYSFSLNRMIERMTLLSLESSGHPLQSDLFAHVHLVRAKEYLGQGRSTLMAAPGGGGVDPAWHAAMGSRFGTFEASIEVFLKETNPSMREVMRATMDEPEMRLALGIMRQAMEGRPHGQIDIPRQRWFDTVTAGINLLREIERYSLTELKRRAENAREDAQWKIYLQRGSLVLFSTLLAWLGISSLRQLLQALDSVLQGARLAADRQGGAKRRTGRRDEAAEISQGVNELLELVDRLNVRASTDALTGALNRHGFNEVAAGELQRAQRYHRDLSLIIADVDHFKRINDSHGHAVGDLVLRELSRLIRENLRGTDIFARWGGEEFIILTPETSVEDAVQLAEKLRRLMESFRTEGLPAFTSSFGLAGCEKVDNLDTLFAKADQALYHAKEAGRNRVVAYAQGPAVRGGPPSAQQRIRVVSDRSGG